MKITDDRQQSRSTSRVILEKVEQNGTYEERRNFFAVEEKLLNHIFRFEKEEAQRAVRLVLDCAFR